MSNDDRWDDNAMSEADSYMNDESYDQEDGQGWHDQQAQGDHYDAAMQQQAEEDQHGGPPRESRKERRRRLAMEAQAMQEQGHQPHYEQAAHADAHMPDMQDQAYAEEAAMHGDDPVAATPKPGKFGFLKKFGKRGKAVEAAGETLPEEAQAAAAQVQISLPMAAVIDPNMLTEYGIDPNTLASMGLDPSTLPQFDTDFLTELGINPNIVIDILHRMMAAEAPAGHGGVESSTKAAWAGKLAIIKRWAPAAAAVTGLTATGAIWFMAGGDEVKDVPEVKVEQLAGAEAEAKVKAEMAKADTEEKPPADEPKEPAQAENLPVAAAVPPSAEPTDQPMPETPGGLSEPPKPDPVQLAAAAMPPGLPGDAAPPAADLPKPPDDLPAPPQEATKDQPPMAGLPTLPGMSDAPPLPPGTADAPPLPVEPAKPPAAEAAVPGAAEKTNIAKDLPPVAAGLGVAALAADQLANHTKDAAAAAVPKDAPPLPTEAPKGLDAPADLPPLGGGNTAAKLGEPSAETPKVEPPAAVGKAAEPPGLPPVGLAGDAKMPEPPPAAGPDSENKKKAVAGLAGLAAGLSIGKAADAIQKAGEHAKPELPKPKEEPPVADHKSAEPPASLPINETKPATPVAAEPKTADLPPLGSVAETNKPSGPGGSAADSALHEQTKPGTEVVAAAKPTGDSAAAKAGLTEAKADWPTIPNGKGRLLRSVVTSGSDTTRTMAGATAGLGAGMMVAQAGRPSSNTQEFADSTSGAGGAEIAPITHVVESGENFWTISRDYYGSGRYYKALWAANRKTVAKIDQLHVGDSIRIPAMEYLDKSLIQPPTVAKSKRAGGSGGADTNPPEVARSLDNRAVRTGNDIESTPTEQPHPAKRPTAPKVIAEPANEKEIISQPVGETTAKGAMHRHRVMPGETIRTIARDRLGDARRDDDIVALNSDVLDNVRSPLQVGMVLKLPPDSKGD